MLTVCIQDLLVDLILITLMDMGFSWMFSDAHCMYTGPISGSDFNHIDGHGFQLDVLRCSLYIYRTY